MINVFPGGTSLTFDFKIQCSPRYMNVNTKHQQGSLPTPKPIPVSPFLENKSGIRLYSSREILKSLFLWQQSFTKFYLLSKPLEWSTATSLPPNVWGHDLAVTHLAQLRDPSLNPVHPAVPKRHCLSRIKRSLRRVRPYVQAWRSKSFFRGREGERDRLLTSPVI